jgi:hypothetical protein
MSRDEESGVLEEVARIHPAVDRLRRLLESATVADLRASTGNYWADRRDDGDRALQAEQA